MIHTLIKITTAIILCTAYIANASEKYSADWNSLKKHQTPAWFQNAKFGIYFHWGIYSYMGSGEWYSHYMYQEDSKLRKEHIKKYGADFQYHEFIPHFTAKYFNAEEWADLFKKSGAKFVGPVAEHCDNFSNWDSKVNPYNTMNMGPKRDLVGELEKSIKSRGMKFVTTFHHSWEWGWYPLWNGLVNSKKDPNFEKFYGEYTSPETFGYFSQGIRESGFYTGDMPAKHTPSPTFVKMWKEKIFEVVDKYKPDFLWFDSRVFLLPEKDRQEVVAHYYNKGKEWGKEVVLSYKNRDLPEGVGVIDLERGRLDNLVEYSWVTDDSWAWNSWSWRPTMRLKTVDVIIDELIDIVSKNGCLLMNITPTCDGKIPDEMRDGLLKIGEWLNVNGEAIYNTRPFVVYGEGSTKLKKNIFGGVQSDGVHYGSHDFRFTKNGDDIYVIQLGLPSSDEENTLKTFADGGKAEKAKIDSVSVLGSDEKIKWSQTNDGLKITAPKVLPNNYAIVYKCSLRK